MRADVRHVQHLQIESPELWEAGCEFRESDLDSRDQLVKFVLKHQAIARPPRALLKAS
jgi:hypothetical protein